MAALRHSTGSASKGSRDSSSERKSPWRSTLRLRVGGPVELWVEANDEDALQRLL